MNYEISSKLRKFAGVLVLTTAGVMSASAVWDGDIDVVFNMPSVASRPINTHTGDLC